MLSATTMTAGKHALKERITRIAENRRTVGAALLAAVTAAALLCAATFTGAKTPDALAGRDPGGGAGSDPCGAEHLYRGFQLQGYVDGRQWEHLCFQSRRIFALRL